MRRSYLTLVVVCSSWGTIPLVVRGVHLPAGAIVFARVWVAVPVLAAALAVRKRGDSPPMPALLSRQPLRCAGAALVLAVHWSALFAAYEHAAAGTVILVVYLGPVGIAAAAPRVLDEHLGRRTMAALGIAVVGFALVALPAVGAASLAGLGLAVVAAATFVVLVLLSKPLSEVYGGLRLTLMELTGAGLLLVPVALTTDWGRPRPAWLLLLILGIGHTAIGTGLYLSALARIPATHAGLLGYLEPAAVVLFAWLFLSEAPGPAMIAGGLLIAAAGVIVVTGSAGRGRFAVAGPAALAAGSAGFSPDAAPGGVRVPG